MSAGQISSLLAIWSAVSFVAEVPAGALADLVDRRLLIASAECVRACGFAAWALWPGYPGFALGFALWGLSGSFVSGSLEALLYDALAADGQAAQFAGILGRVRAAGLVAQLPVAGAAAGLFALGGYSLAAWCSAGMSIVAAAAALRLPNRRPPPTPPADTRAGDARPADGSRPVAPGGAVHAPTWRGALRDGWAQVARSAVVRRAVLVVAVVDGLDAAEEYFALIVRDRGLPIEAVPFGVAAVYVFAAGCGAAAGLIRGWSPLWVALLLGGAGCALGAVVHVPQAAAIALLALYYGASRLVIVIAEARLQEVLEQGSRATATSIASLATEVACFAVYGAWAIHQVTGLAVLTVLVAAVVGTQWPRSGTGEQ
jgi:MFS family permease